MPLYEYQCVKCHKKTEKIESVSGPHLKKCPYCGGKLERVLTAPAIQFKGAGWYVTDYAVKNATPGDASSSEKSAPKESAKDSAKESPATKDSKDKKPSQK